MRILDKCFIFLGILGSLAAYQEIPDQPDPAFVPLTFLEQERAVVMDDLKNYKLTGSETILHLGCRDGYLSNEIAKYLPEGSIVGLENIYTEEPHANSNNVSFIQGKFVEQGWENCYDYIICTQFDEWEDNPDKLFCAIRKALKPWGKAIILICTNTTLSEVDPLKKWLQKNPENQEFTTPMKFWSNIDSLELRSIMKKYPDIHLIKFVTRRLIACFRDLEQFEEDARKWFRKIPLLPPPLQTLSLNQLSAITKKDGTIHHEGVNYYRFIYRLEIAHCRKEG